MRISYWKLYNEFYLPVARVPYWLSNSLIIPNGSGQLNARAPK